ncbi:MAG: SDR family oxidoreductase [Shinella sp.]|nr:MAG: SDR family oxidoreductase [Shinella sp.]
MSDKNAVLITGASTGIGAVYAERFARRGHDLVLVARNIRKLEENAARLRAETGVSVDLLPADLTDEGQLAAVEARLRDDASIGILVNNAGGNVGGTFLTQNAEDLTRLVMLNATSVLRLSHAIAPRFAERGEGAIVNVSSVLALAPEWGSPVYSATKAFVLTLSQALQTDLGPKGVYVQAVLPGATRTDIWNFVDDARRPPMMEVADLVDAALVGFDRREEVTIPPLHDEARFQSFEAARISVVQGIGNTTPGERYLTAV